MNTQLAPVEEIERRIDKVSAGAIAVSDTGVALRSMNEVMEYAKMMSVAQQAVPPHCRGNPGICLAIVDQALRWEMSPMAVANKSYVVNDRVAYEAQLVMALVNTRAGIVGRLSYEFTGEGQALRCRVSGTFPGGEVVTYESPPIGSIQPKNSPLWKVDPARQLTYWSARAWARVHVPEVLLGVDCADDVRDAGPRGARQAASTLMDRLGAGRPQHAIEGEPSIAQRAASAALPPAGDRPGDGVSSVSDAGQPPLDAGGGGSDQSASTDGTDDEFSPETADDFLEGFGHELARAKTPALIDRIAGNYAAKITDLGCQARADEMVAARVAELEHV